MQFLLINGSPHVSGTTKRALRECEAALNSFGDECIYYELGSQKRAACISCGGCSGGNICKLGDIDELCSAVMSADGIIIGAPTHYGAAPGTLSSVLSRLCRSCSAHLCAKPVGALAVGRRGALSQTVSDITRFFTFTASVIVNGRYPTVAYGANALQLELDLEGLQNIRTLAAAIHNAASIRRSTATVDVAFEEKVKTDFSGNNG